MATKLETFTKIQLKKDLPDIRPGDTVRIHQKVKEKGKERIQVFEGIVLARKHGKGISATIIVRKVISGIGVEKIFPIHSPVIEKIEVVKRSKVRRAKLYYLRTVKGKKAKLKRKEFAEAIAEPASVEATANRKEPNPPAGGEEKEELAPASSETAISKEEKK